jgi:chaperone required for assembly of F1-ATPase
MRDLLNDLEASLVSDPDPVRRAQNQMRQPLPKRFYETAEVAETGEGFAVRLDGRPVRTPGRAVLALPSAAAAELVAAEFAAQGQSIDPVSMPVLRLVNSAIDGVAADMQAVLEDIVGFSGSDLVCYRADSPAMLVARQAQAWDPVLDWARGALGVRFYLAEGVVHVEQPADTLGAVRNWLDARREPFRLGAIHVMTTLTGSALLALAVEAGALTPDAAWAAAHVDETWTVEHWGEDAEAAARIAARRRDFDAAVALVRSL